ncbi:MAG: hypothetical protein JSS67_01715 [Bacteroidetes bacterium]|nr:hypothetical protein [Bacteroidota bacterium]
MKKLFIIFFALLIQHYICYAQQGGGNDQVEVVKMAYITNQLNLSPNEASRFWPVYNQYYNELKQARAKNQNDEIAYSQQVLNIQKKYQSNFRQILGNNSNRINKAFTAERGFRELLKNEQQKREIQNIRKPPKRNGGKNGKSI